MNYKPLESAAITVKAINHKLRQVIIDILIAEPRMSVTDLYIRMREEQSVISSHLAILRSVKIVKTARDGKSIRYSVNKERLEQILSLATQMASK